MPLLLNHDMPVYRMLLAECPEILADEASARSEQVHDLLLLNLMSDKVGAELQYLRCLGSARQLIRVDFMRQDSFRSSARDDEYLQRFYLSLEDVRDRHYDAMIMTGAPLEHIPFENVFFWEEFCRILKWSRANVHSVLHSCWSAFGGVYYDFGVAKINLDEKYSGIYDLHIHHPEEPLLVGCGSDICVPLSRASDMDTDAARQHPELIILASAANGTPVYLKSSDNRRFYITGHPEYDRDRLALEYERDRDKEYAWKNPFPCNYFPSDDVTKTPTDRWIASGRQIFRNWMEFYVDKTTAVNR